MWIAKGIICINFVSVATRHYYQPKMCSHFSIFPYKLASCIIQVHWREHLKYQSQSDWTLIGLHWPFASFLIQRFALKYHFVKDLKLSHLFVIIFFRVYWLKFLSHSASYWILNSPSIYPSFLVFFWYFRWATDFYKF